MTHTRAEAVTRAKAVKSFDTGMCLRWVRTMFAIPAAGDYDDDGDADAVDAWKRARRRHPGALTPPAGVPVFWTGGSRGHGHVAMSLGNGNVRSTDWPTAGQVGDVDIATLTARWGLPYAGWTEDLNGVTIPGGGVGTRGRRRDKALRLLIASRTAGDAEARAATATAIAALEGITPR